MKRNFLIIGKRSTGKTRLAELISANYHLPLFDGIGSLSDINGEGVYVSNSISHEEAKENLPAEFTIILVEVTK